MTPGRATSDERRATPGPPAILTWALLIVVLGGVSVAFVVRSVQRLGPQAPPPAVPDIRIPLPEFTFTEASGRPLSRSDLLDKIWIADFIFTYCAGPCPLMSRKMKRLQEDLSDLPDLQLVSFSVDPERDTPEVLRAYGRRYGADPRRWLFLTGDMDRIYDVAIDGFKITVEEARQTHEIIHDTRFILVDAEGAIRGYYDSDDPADLRALRERARQLASGH